MKIRVTMQDGSMWDVPCDYVLQRYVQSNTEESLEEATQFFEEYPHELILWAEENLVWSEVSVVAKQVRSPVRGDYVLGWECGDKSLV